MSPLWSFFGTALGVISSKLGENYVHACTESVEEVIVKHYKDQLNFLNNKKIKGDLRQKIKRFCDDEDSHRKDASESALSSESYGITIFKKITKVGTRLAIGFLKNLIMVLVLSPNKEIIPTFMKKIWRKHSSNFF